MKPPIAWNPGREGPVRAGRPVRSMSRGGQSGLFRTPAISDLALDPRDVAGLDDDDVEAVARAIQLRGATVPAVFFLEANRGLGSLDGLGMLLFDPVIRGVFGGDVPGARILLADEDGIERLIDRLEELEAEVGLDA
jgi:hypothetical protein